jgi:hypothetical protein
MLRSDTPSRTAWWMLSLGWHPEESYITCSFREFCLCQLPESYTKLFVYTERTEGRTAAFGAGFTRKNAVA